MIEKEDVQKWLSESVISVKDTEDFKKIDCMKNVDYVGV